MPHLAPDIRRELCVLAFEIDDHHRVGAGQQVRQDNRHTFTRAGRGEHRRMDGLGEADELFGLFGLTRRKELVNGLLGV